MTCSALGLTFNLWNLLLGADIISNPSQPQLGARHNTRSPVSEDRRTVAPIFFTSLRSTKVEPDLEESASNLDAGMLDVGVG